MRRHNAPPDEGEEDIRRHTEEIFEMFDEHSTGFIVAQDLILHAESKLAERQVCG